jgi:hypothetical protein
VLFGDIDGGAQGSFGKIRARITELSERVLTQADRLGVSPRAAALTLATEHLAEITARYGAQGDGRS